MTWPCPVQDIFLSNDFILDQKEILERKIGDTNILRIFFFIQNSLKYFSMAWPSSEPNI